MSTGYADIAGVGNDENGTGVAIRSEWSRDLDVMNAGKDWADEYVYSVTVWPGEGEAPAEVLLTRADLRTLVAQAADALARDGKP
jgi:hypothetical protein